MLGRDVLISWVRNIPWSSQKTKDFRREIIWDFFSSIWDFFAIFCQASRYRARFQASSVHSDSANRPGYEAGKTSHFLRRKHSRSTGNISRTAIYNSTDNNCYLFEEYMLDWTSVFILVLLLNGAVEESMFRKENYSELIMKMLLDLAFALSEEHQLKSNLIMNC